MCPCFLIRSPFFQGSIISNLIWCFLFNCWNKHLILVKVYRNTKLLISEEYSYQNFQKNISVAKIFFDCLCICSVDMSEFGGKDALCGSSCLGLSMSVMYMSFRVLLSFVFFFFFW